MSVKVHHTHSVIQYLTQRFCGKKSRQRNRSLLLAREDGVQLPCRLSYRSESVENGQYVELHQQDEFREVESLAPIVSDLRQGSTTVGNRESTVASASANDPPYPGSTSASALTIYHLNAADERANPVISANPAISANIMPSSPTASIILGHDDPQDDVGQIPHTSDHHTPPITRAQIRTQSFQLPVQQFSPEPIGRHMRAWLQPPIVQYSTIEASHSEPSQVETDQGLMNKSGLVFPADIASATPLTPPQHHGNVHQIMSHVPPPVQLYLIKATPKPDETEHRSTPSKDHLRVPSLGSRSTNTHTSPERNADNITTNGRVLPSPPSSLPASIGRRRSYPYLALASPSKLHIHHRNAASNNHPLKADPDHPRTGKNRNERYSEYPSLHKSASTSIMSTRVTVRSNGLARPLAPSHKRHRHQPLSISRSFTRSSSSSGQSSRNIIHLPVYHSRHLRC